MNMENWIGFPDIADEHNALYKFDFEDSFCDMYPTSKGVTYNPKFSGK